MGHARRFIMAVACVLGMATSEWCTSATAQIVTFTNEADFLAAFEPTPFVENFSSLTPNQYLSTATFTGPGAGGPFSFTATAAAGLYVLPSDPPGGGNWLSTNTGRDSMGFSITGATATGFGTFPFLTTLPGALMSGTMQLTVNGASSYTLNDPSPTKFFGLVSTDPINSITLEYLGSDEAFVTTGQITLGVAAVPEPSTYAMALAGLACGGFSMWRRRKRA